MTNAKLKLIGTLQSGTNVLFGEPSLKNRKIFGNVHKHS